MRCLTLARAMHNQGWRISIAVDETAGPTLSRNETFDYTVVSLPHDRSRSAETLMDRVDTRCRVLVVDDYTLDSTFEAALSGWAENILVVDDLADRSHDCRYLLDASPRRSESAYAGLVPPTCKILSGPAFALIRQEFALGRANALGRRAAIRSVDRILISFGLTDVRNMTLTALEAVRSSGLHLMVDVVLGAEAPHLNEVSRFADTMGSRVIVHRNPKNLADLINGADLAIGAPGVSSLERCCLGLPTVTVPVADNQNHNGRALADIGAIELLDADISASNLSFVLNQVAGDIDAVRRMSAAAFGVCDGRGAARTFLSVSPEATKAGGGISCRPVTTSDTDTIFRWQCAPGSRNYSRNPNPPTYVEHRAWMLLRLAPNPGLFEMMLMDGTPAGFVRLDADPSAPDAYEISILISSEMRGKGVGAASLAAVRRLVPEGTFLALVHQDNLPSHKIFSAAGYVLEGDHFVSHPAS